MKYLVAVLFFSLSFSGISQSVFNDYKYIVVPNRFDTFKKDNQYQTSTLVKHLLVQKGFTVVYQGTMPEELTFNRCLGLYVNLIDDSSLFTTKLKISFKDCTSKELFLTEEGKSKEKEFKKSYSEAITMALQYVNGINYKYAEKQKKEPITISYKNDVKKLPTKENQEKNSNKVNSKVVEQKATQENQFYKSKEPISSSKNIKKKNEVETTTVLYAQEIENGYQLIDSTPSIIMKIYKGSVADMYFVKDGETNNGVVVNKDGVWYHEYYVSGSLVTKKLNIKF